MIDIGDNLGSFEEYFANININNNSNNANNETPEFGSYEKDNNNNQDTNYILPKGGQTGEVKMKDVGNLCANTLKPKNFNKEENGNENKETNIANEQKNNNNTNILFDNYVNNSSSVNILSLSENNLINIINNYFEKNTFSETIKNKCQENKQLPKVKLEGKTYSYDRNKGILKEHKPEEEDKKCKEIFCFRLPIINNQSKEDDDESSLSIFLIDIKIVPFNCDTFQKNPNNNINSKDIYQFLSLKTIVNKYGKYLKNLYPQIFKNKKELVNMGKSVICKNIVKYLRGRANKEKEDKENEEKEDKENEEIEDKENEEIEDKENEDIEDKANEKKNNKPKKKKIHRIADPDKITSKILNNLAFSFREATNLFEEFKISQIGTIKYELINQNINADFILEYLRQPLYKILSNESSKNKNKKSNKSIIEEIMNINKNNKSKEVIIHLNLTVQKCLDYFRYKEENPRFKYKLVDFLVEEFESQKKKKEKSQKKKRKEKSQNDKKKEKPQKKKKKEKSQNYKKKEIISFSKQYIASLLLLTYNFERCFQIKKINEENRNKNKNKRNLFVSVKQIPKRNKLFVIERSINKKRKKNEKYNPKKLKGNNNINNIDEPVHLLNKKKYFSLDIKYSSNNNSLCNNNSFLIKNIFQENKISSKIEEIKKSNNQSLKNDNDSMQNNCKIKDNKKQNIFSVIKDNDKII